MSAPGPDADNAIQRSDGKTLDKVIQLEENGKSGLVKLVKSGTTSISRLFHNGVYTKSIYPAVGETHPLGDWVITKKPTCTEKGERQRSCKVEHCVVTETEELPALGHQWSDWTPVKGDSRREYRICEVCNEVEYRDVSHNSDSSDNSTLSTGLRVLDPAQADEVLFDQAMPADELHRLIDHLRNFDVIPMISLGRDLHVEDSYHCMITLPDGSQKNIVKYERDACDLKIREVESLHEVADAYPVDKLLTAGDPAYLQAHYEEMYAPFKQTLSGMFTADWYFEYTAPGIDKARALEGALPKLGIDASEVVSFGDGQNDKSMIEWAGTGVAMGNAVDEVKAVAQMVTANNNEDGIAVALDKLLG